MIVIYFLIPLSVLIAAGFLAAFIWAVRSGQYEDTCTPSMRLLMDDESRAQRAKLSEKDKAKQP
ncbi:MAG: cbb3-type cytochrome oxidase assembly protein CcoS [Limisphaerales bacterium]